jgi:hypothetical protein
MDGNLLTLSRGNKKALRRHHDRRLKRKRRLYGSLCKSDSPKVFGRTFQTPCRCSCWMCGNQRKHHGLKIQEHKALEKFNLCTHLI